MIKKKFSFLIILACLSACEDQETKTVAVELAGMDEVVAGMDEVAAGSNEVTAGSDEEVAGTDEVTAGSDEEVAGMDEEVAGSDEEVAGAEEVTAGTEEVEMIPMEPERPELPVGREDLFTEQACQLLDLEMTPIEAVSDRSDAGQVLLLPSETTAYQIRLPESGLGYITLEVPDWAITVGLFTHFSQSVRVDNSSGNIEIVRQLSWNASCEDITDERLHFHSWGSYLVELRGEPNSDVDLALLKRQ